MMKTTTPSEPTTPTNAPDVPCLSLRPRDAALALGIGERLLWSMTNRGEVPHTRLGRTVVYPVAALEAWLSERAGMKNRPTGR